MTQPYEPYLLSRIRAWILWWAVTLFFLLAALTEMSFAIRDRSNVMSAKITAEKEVAELRQYIDALKKMAYLTPWEKVEITYYADTFHGRTAANGSTFSQNLPTCATTVPALVGKVLIVKSLDGKRLVPLIVTDRLPESRMDRLDVSAYAAQRLGITVNGRATLEVAMVEVGK